MQTSESGLRQRRRERTWESIHQEAAALAAERGPKQTTAELIADREAYLVPTLACYAAMDRRGAEVGLSEFGMDKNRMVLERGQDAVRLALEAGVRVGFGTDLMGDLHTEQLDGLRLQVEAVGLAETIRSATAVNAELMGLSDRGALAPGCLADLLVLPGDLAERPDLLWDAAAARTVIQRGRVVAGGADVAGGAEEAR